MGAHRGDVANGPRFEAAPLLDVIERMTGRRPGDDQIARALDVTRVAVLHARSRNLSRYQADEWALKLTGLHPVFIWPEWGEWIPSAEGAA